MNRVIKIVALAVLAVLLPACEGATDKTDGGGILLSVSDFDGLPISISASAAAGVGTVQVGQITVQSVVKNPSRATSELMTVEISSYEVTFQRDDLGTRIPPALLNFIFGTVAAGGTYELENGPIMRIDQFNNAPIRDLLEFGFDTETGSSVIRLKVGIQFFGKTLSGDTVESAPGYFTLEVFP